MRKMYRAAVGLSLGLSVMLASGICAQQVTLVGEPVTLNVLSSQGDDAQSQQVTAETVVVLAQAGEDMMLVRTGDTAGFVSKDELRSVLPQLEYDRFPSFEEAAAVTPDAGEEAITLLQESLVALGMLDGEADGIYGGNTAEAVRKFQEANGLEATGAADLYTMLAIDGALEGLEMSITLSSDHYDSVGEKFAAIADHTDADLEPFMTDAWQFTFDVIEDKGVIDPFIELGLFSVESPEVDQIVGVLSARVVVIWDDAVSSYVLIPAITVDTEGAYRPYVQGLLLSGDHTQHLTDGVSTGEIDGILLRENAYVPLTKEAIELLKSGSLQAVRVLGKNESYNVELDFSAEKLAAFMEACEGLVE